MTQRYRAILALCMAASSLPASAIGVGSLTTEMPANTFFVTKDIRNDDAVAKFVSVSATQIDNPYDMKALPKQHKDVLVSPATVFLSPHRTAPVKLYYQGARDGAERYYRLSFTEQSVTPESNLDAHLNVSARKRLRIDSVLVVRPREIRFAFENDGNGTVRNTGNTYLEVTASGTCEKADAPGPRACSRSAFLLPGEVVDLKQAKGVRSLSGVGIWRGTDYEYFPIETAPTKVSAH